MSSSRNTITKRKPNQTAQSNTPTSSSLAAGELLMSPSSRLDEQSSSKNSSQKKQKKPKQQTKEELLMLQLGIPPETLNCDSILICPLPMLSESIHAVSAATVASHRESTSVTAATTTKQSVSTNMTTAHDTVQQPQPSQETNSVSVMTTPISTISPEGKLLNIHSSAPSISVVPNLLPSQSIVPLSATSSPATTSSSANISSKDLLTQQQQQKESCTIEHSLSALNQPESSKVIQSSQQQQQQQPSQQQETNLFSHSNLRFFSQDRVPCAFAIRPCSSAVMKLCSALEMNSSEHLFRLYCGSFWVISDVSFARMLNQLQTIITTIAIPANIFTNLISWRRWLLEQFISICQRKLIPISNNNNNRNNTNQVSHSPHDPAAILPKDLHFIFKIRFNVETGELINYSSVEMLDLLALETQSIIHEDRASIFSENSHLTLSYSHVDVLLSTILNLDTITTSSTPQYIKQIQSFMEQFLADGEFYGAHLPTVH